MSMTIQTSVKDKILATPSETSKEENAPAEMLRKANVVTDALIRKERVKPRRVPLVGSEIDDAHALRYLTERNQKYKWGAKREEAFQTLKNDLCVKDKILATSSETPKYEYEICYHPGKANVVTYALSSKERMKPRRVRAMAMTIQYGVRGMILAAQSEAFKQENILAERLHGLDQQMERKEEESLYFKDRI
ncbi:hypothetical protein Tco_1342723 [Tanacetum coccineum]